MAGTISFWNQLGAGMSGLNGDDYKHSDAGIYSGLCDAQVVP